MIDSLVYSFMFLWIGILVIIFIFSIYFLIVVNKELNKMNKKELYQILEEHKLWLDSNGKNGKRADLTGANLSDADLRKADLSYADLSDANLRDADLMGAKGINIEN